MKKKFHLKSLLIDFHNIVLFTHSKCPFEQKNRFICDIYFDNSTIRFPRLRCDMTDKQINIVFIKNFCYLYSVAKRAMQ